MRNDAVAFGRGGSDGFGCIYLFAEAATRAAVDKKRRPYDLPMAPQQAACGQGERKDKDASHLGTDGSTRPLLQQDREARETSALVGVYVP